ncbi:hypothetical protein M378DRAFT_156493, partial [Amanita muscaria Koide BX008]
MAITRMTRFSTNREKLEPDILDVIKKGILHWSHTSSTVIPLASSPRHSQIA